MPEPSLTSNDAAESGFRRIVFAVAAANLIYFLIEFSVARRIGSVSLFADSIDFLEDTSLNLLILFAAHRSLVTRSRVGKVLATLILVPTISVLWTAWTKFNAPTPPEVGLLSGTGLGALVVNFGCALLLVRYRHHKGSLTRAAFLSARNDVFANIAIIVTALVTAAWHSGWPDLITGLGIAGMNADAAGKVWRAAQAERDSAENS